MQQECFLCLRSDSELNFAINFTYCFCMTETYRKSTSDNRWKSKIDQKYKHVCYNRYYPVSVQQIQFASFISAHHWQLLHNSGVSIQEDLTCKKLYVCREGSLRISTIYFPGSQPGSAKQGSFSLWSMMLGKQ